MHLPGTCIGSFRAAYYSPLHSHVAEKHQSETRTPDTLTTDPTKRDPHTAASREGLIDKPCNMELRRRADLGGLRLGPSSGKETRLRLQRDAGLDGDIPA